MYPDDYLDPGARSASNDRAVALNQWLGDVSRDLRDLQGALWKVANVEYHRLGDPVVRTYRDPNMAKTIPEHIAAIREQANRVCDDWEAAFPPEPEAQRERLLDRLRSR